MKTKQDTCPDCSSPKDYRSVRCRACSRRHSKPWNSEQRQRHSEWWHKKAAEGNPPGSKLGTKQSQDTIQKRLLTRGMNYLPIEERGSRWKYFLWAKAVKERDLVCVYCGGEDRLHAHHILSKNKHPLLSLKVDNGITLCHGCHWDEHRLNGYL